MYKYFIINILAFVIFPQANAQSIISGVEADIEMSGTVSTGDYAPLWLSANKQGLVSPYSNSSYERLSINRDLSIDSLKAVKIGYGFDIQYQQNSLSNVFVHQAYAQINWKKALLTIGQKEKAIDLRNNELSSGGLSQGINSRPLPEILLSVDYFSVPFTSHWWKMAFRGGYGMYTDGNWQESWVADKEKNRYMKDALYHEKALYWKFGREEKFPLTFEIGLQMMTQFGGTSYSATGQGITGNVDIKHSTDLNAFWEAFMPIGSSDETDMFIDNASGNIVGSYNMRLTYHAYDEDYTDYIEKWNASLYFERVFEDQSMLTVQYGIYDHLLGLEVNLPKNKYVSSIVVEHLSTKDQAGPVFHDITSNMPEHFAGRDDYYNHTMYSGWHYWGMSMGTPLLLSPIYNNDHQLTFKSNRTQACHVGISGDPIKSLHWRALCTFTRDWGTYPIPYKEILSHQHYMFELSYKPSFIKDFTSTFSIGYSHGKVLSNTLGAQLTIRKSFNL